MIDVRLPRMCPLNTIDNKYNFEAWSMNVVLTNQARRQLPPILISWPHVFTSPVLWPCNHSVGSHRPSSGRGGSPSSGPGLGHCCNTLDNITLLDAGVERPELLVLPLEEPPGRAAPSAGPTRLGPDGGYTLLEPEVNKEGGCKGGRPAVRPGLPLVAGFGTVLEADNRAGLPLVSILVVKEPAVSPWPGRIGENSALLPCPATRGCEAAAAAPPIGAANGLKACLGRCSLRCWVSRTICSAGSRIAGVGVDSRSKNLTNSSEKDWKEKSSG